MTKAVDNVIDFIEEQRKASVKSIAFLEGQEYEQAKKELDEHLHSVPAKKDAESEEWNTPKWLVGHVQRFLDGIDLDPCTEEGNPCQANRFFTKQTNGLVRPWYASSVYMNPPYKRGIEKWVGKLRHEYLLRNFQEAVLLMPARPDTKWWGMLSDLPVCFMAGRLKFNDGDGGGKFASAMLYLGNRNGAFMDAWAGLGRVYQPWPTNSQSIEWSKFDATA